MMLKLTNNIPIYNHLKKIVIVVYNYKKWKYSVNVFVFIIISILFQVPEKFMIRPCSPEALNTYLYHQE